MMKKQTKYITLEYITSDEAKKFRKSNGMTQQELADFMRCSKPTIERWEQNGKIKGTAGLLIDILSRHPEIMAELRIPDRVLPIRLWYMHGQHVCTMIDADEIEQRISIRNYTDNLLLRAFGKNEKPTFEDYEAFLESRCFPKQRDKLKLILRDLDLPFYDPMMIIRKTEGRMAEDDFWIKIEE